MIAAGALLRITRLLLFTLLIVIAFFLLPRFAFVLIGSIVFLGFLLLLGFLPLPFIALVLKLLVLLLIVSLFVLLSFLLLGLLFLRCNWVTKRDLEMLAAADIGRHSQGDERADRLRLDQHPCLRRKYRRRAPPHIRSRHRRPEPVRVGLHQPGGAQSVGSVGGDESRPLAILSFLQEAPARCASACADADASDRPSRLLPASRPARCRY